MFQCVHIQWGHFILSRRSYPHYVCKLWANTPIRRSVLPRCLQRRCKLLFEPRENSGSVWWVWRRGIMPRDSSHVTWGSLSWHSQIFRSQIRVCGPRYVTMTGNVKGLAVKLTEVNWDKGLNLYIYNDLIPIDIMNYSTTHWSIFIMKFVIAIFDIIASL